MWCTFANGFDKAKIRAIEMLTEYDSRVCGVMITPISKDYCKIAVYEFGDTAWKEMKEQEWV